MGGKKNLESFWGICEENFSAHMNTSEKKNGANYDEYLPSCTPKKYKMLITIESIDGSFPLIKVTVDDSSQLIQKTFI